MQKLSTRTILSYPGGKTVIREYLMKCFPPEISLLVSPFTGGAGFELHATKRGLPVRGHDNFEPVANFWQQLLLNPVGLHAAALSLHPVDYMQYENMRDNYLLQEDKLTRAAWYYALNKLGYAGKAFNGGFSKEGKKFTVSGINRIKDFYNPYFTVRLQDYRTTFQEYQTEYMYVDPPYVEVDGRHYQYYGILNDHFDHYEFFNWMNNRTKWVLSYNDHPLIRHLYQHYRMVQPKWKYVMSNGKQTSNELLIFSNDIVIP